jgi:hypothetical protein
MQNKIENSCKINNDIKVLTWFSGPSIIKSNLSLLMRYARKTLAIKKEMIKKIVHLKAFLIFLRSILVFPNEFGHHDRLLSNIRFYGKPFLKRWSVDKSIRKISVQNYRKKDDKTPDYHKEYKQINILRPKGKPKILNRRSNMLNIMN